MKKLILLFCLITNLSFAQTGKEKILVTDMTKLKTVANVAISPDGKRAVYALKTNEPNETDKLDFDYRSHLWLTDFQGVKQLLGALKALAGLRGVLILNKSPLLET